MTSTRGCSASTDHWPRQSPRPCTTGSCTPRSGSSAANADDQAAASDVVVVDLESGKAWWETRLLVLAAGAARRNRPRVVVFVARLGEDDRQFVGWARPAAIRDVLLASDLRYQQAMDQARATATAVLLRRAEGATVQVTMAGPVGVIAGSAGNAALSPFLEEQLLAAELGKHEADDPRELSAARLRDLLGPALRTGSVDTSDSSAAWFRAALMKEDDFALTDRGRYVAIPARCAVGEDYPWPLVGHLRRLGDAAEGGRRSSRPGHDLGWLRGGWPGTRWQTRSVVSRGSRGDTRNVSATLHWCLNAYTVASPQTA